MLKKKLLAVGLLFTVCGKLSAQSDSRTGNIKTSLGFIEGIQFVIPGNQPDKVAAVKKDSTKQASFTDVMKTSFKQTLGVALETFLPFQFKYAILLNESVEKVTNIMLYQTIDDWYGTRYRFGGSTEKGIDCSAFMQVLAGYAFGWMLPRTAREQYAAMMKISRQDLKEGDFVFFNTRGGVSHVGMYLQNNKFVHSSSSQGVSIGDLDDSYWSRRFLGARRASQNAQPNFPKFN
jgi:lipoprotein Spr